MSRSSRSALAVVVVVGGCVRGVATAPPPCVAVGAGHDTQSAAPSVVGSGGASAAESPPSEAFPDSCAPFAPKGKPVVLSMHAHASRAGFGSWDYDKTPHMSIGVTGDALLLLERPGGIVTWNGKAFARHPELEKGLHLDDKGNVDHAINHVTGAWPSGAYIVSGGGFEAPRLYRRSGDAWKEVHRCGYEGTMSVGPWGNGVLSHCAARFGGGEFAVHGPKPNPLPKLPMQKVRRADDYGGCLRTDTLLEPATASISLEGVQSYMKSCNGFHGALMDWDPNSGMWLPAPPVSARSAIVGDVEWTLDDKTCSVSSNDTYVKLPEPRARVSNVWARGKELWVEGVWIDRPSKTVHVGLFGSPETVSVYEAP